MARKIVLATLVTTFVLIDFVSPCLASQNSLGLTPARVEALRACNDQANKFAQYVWGVTQLQIYRTCMAARNQAE